MNPRTNVTRGGKSIAAASNTGSDIVNSTGRHETGIKSAITTIGNQMAIAGIALESVAPDERKLPASKANAKAMVPSSSI